MGESDGGTVISLLLDSLGFHGQFRVSWTVWGSEVLGPYPKLKTSSSTC